jgi:hypothetical protein
MQCPRCSYTLSYSDVLLCRVGETHYCPRCWSRIEESVEIAVSAEATPSSTDRPKGTLAKNGKDTTRPSGASD